MAKWTNEALSIFSPETSMDLSSVTSSPASGAGRSLFDSLDGLTPDPSGPAPVPSSRSRAPAPRLGAMIRATFGRRGFASSASAALTASLVSRLKRQLDMDGSILFAMTWKEKATPSGRLVYRVQCRARTTFAAGYGSWPSPTVGDNSNTRNSSAVRHTMPPTGIHAGHTLVDAADLTLSGWPTPDAALMNDGADPVKHQQRRERLKAKWGNGNGAGLPLGQAVHLAGWPTALETDGAKNVRTAEGAAKEIARKGGPQDLNQATSLIVGIDSTTATTAAAGILPTASTAAPSKPSDGTETTLLASGSKAPSAQQATPLANWPTPTTHDAERGWQGKRALGETRHGSNLQDFALLAGWATPR
ncbi:MAG: hypothetical protein RLZZ373_1197, partial [Pseudomonadota bacterium]